MIKSLITLEFYLVSDAKAISEQIANAHDCSRDELVEGEGLRLFISEDCAQEG